MKYPRILTALLVLSFVAAAERTAFSETSAAVEIERENADFMIAQTMRLNDIGCRLFAAIPPHEGGGETRAMLPFVFLEPDADQDSKVDDDKPRKVIVGGLIPSFKSDLDVRRGDRILRFQGMAVESAEQLRDYVGSSRDVSRALMRFSRDGTEMDVRVPIQHFNFAANIYAWNQDGQAYSGWTRGGIMVSPPLIKMAESDDELAYVIAHEIAHGVLRHRRLQVSDTSANAMNNIVAAAVASALNVAPTVQPWEYMDGPYAEKDEVEADLSAVRYMRAAGFDPQAAYDFLKKQELELKASGRESQRYVHPLSVDRLALVKKSITETVAVSSESVHAVNLPAPLPVSASDQEELGVIFSGGADPIAAKVSRVGLAESVRYSFGYDNEIKPQDALIFSTHTRRIVWHADDEDNRPFYYRELRVEWYRPDGRLYHEDRRVNSNVGNTFRSGVSLKAEEAGSNIGRWRVRVTHDKQVVDERYFLINDTHARILKKRSEIQKGGVR